MKILIKKLSENARIPQKQTSGSAGYDLYSAEDCHVLPLNRVLAKTDISINIPEGYYGRIAPRSGLAFKNGIDVLAGVIDSDYRGNVGVILFNTDQLSSFKVKKGDRIAQIIFEKHEPQIDFEEMEHLENSKRGEEGYGSSGLN